MKTSSSLGSSSEILTRRPPLLFLFLLFFSPGFSPSTFKSSNIYNYCNESCFLDLTFSRVLSQCSPVLQSQPCSVLFTLGACISSLQDTQIRKKKQKRHKNLCLFVLTTKKEAQCRFYSLDVRDSMCPT